MSKKSLKVVHPNAVPQAVKRSSREYQTLLKNIITLYQDAQKKADTTLKKILWQTYWEIGRYIIVFEQDNNIRAQYGKHVLQNLSVDLTRALGKGFSVSYLSDMRLLYRKNRISPPEVKLDWSKQRLLLSINTDGRRKALEQKVLKNHLSKRQILEHLKARPGMVKNSPSDRDPMKKLTAVKGRLLTRAVIPSVTGKMRVDLGFSIRRELPADQSGPWKEDDLLEILDNGALKKYEPPKGSPNPLYTYEAVVERVIDGDTLICEILCGLGVTVRQRLRLRGVDCPELKTKPGEKAKRFVQSKLKKTDVIVIKTHLSDKYDRPLADVWFGPDEQYLNQLLLDEGLAMWSE